MRGRGLKHETTKSGDPVNIVAPHAGAWIETLVLELNELMYSVAPHAGAWIETTVKTGSYTNRDVAPHAGAWIETRDGER